MPCKPILGISMGTVTMQPQLTHSRYCHGHGWGYSSLQVHAGVWWLFGCFGCVCVCVCVCVCFGIVIPWDCDCDCNCVLSDLICWSLAVRDLESFTRCIFKFNLPVSHLQNYPITITLSEYYYHLFQSVPSKTSQYYEWSVHMDGFACTEIISFFV